MISWKALPKEPNFPDLEEGILKFWQKNRIFEKTLRKTRKSQPFVFFEGPPTANGKPHIGHFLTRIFKDIIPRYKTMRGYFVLRKGGWDTQGLPVEIEVEKELGISGKQDIENLVPGDRIKSIAKFNKLCKRSVFKYVKLWEEMVRRVGNWFDLENPYVTYENDYIESVWWAFKEYWKRGLLYRGYKVVPFCTRCGTPLSSHEVAQGYEEITDTSLYLKFPAAGEKDTYFLVWTTTPWTLPSNIALAVDPHADYIKAKEQGKESFLIVAKDRAKALGLTEAQKEIKGSELVGRHYRPPFPYLRALIDRNAPQFQIVEADFVSLEEGTGIVHTAVMYGEEDFALGQKLGLPQRHLVDKNGRFTRETGWLAGKYVKDADPLIIHDLRSRGLVFAEEKIRHQYPFCWRCHKPLIYYALESWFIKTTAKKEELLKNNREVNWVPEYIGRGRMGNWYETLIDWSVSRNRYWGTPLPAWVCDKNPDHIEVIGSFDELAKRMRKRLPADFDPHRPFIDEHSWSCAKRDGGTMKRVPEVTDAWHDSGCMPFAQWHYPFENKEMIDSSSSRLKGAGGQQFPADYISEAIDQTRGWFFSLQAVSTLLFGKSPYKNVVVFAHALDEKGRKMSKHLGNVMDPWEAINAVGVDPIRWFFLTSVTIGTPYRTSVEYFRETKRRFFLILWNCLSFFTTYANLDRWMVNQEGQASPAGDLLDRWIMASLHDLVEEVTKKLDVYDFPSAGRKIQDFVSDDLSTWYIRRSRDRVGPAADNQDDKNAFHQTTYQVLRTLAVLLAPFTPFFAEFMFQRLRQKNDLLSVHLLSWPRKGRVDRKLLESMAEARQAVEQGLRVRKEKGIRLRQPLSQAALSGAKNWPKALSDLVAAELNVEKVKLIGGRKLTLTLETKVTKELLEKGILRDLIRKIQELRRQAGYRFDQKVKLAVVTKDPVLWRLTVKNNKTIEEWTLTRMEKAIVNPDIEGSFQSATLRLKK